MPVSGKYKDMGTMIEGKVEAGQCKKGGNYILMPNKDEVSVSALYGETEDEIPGATCGDQVRMRLRGIEEEDILPGFVLCDPKRPVHCVAAFEAQIALLELKSILSSGFNCVLHVHSAIEEVTFAALLHKLEKGTGRKSKKPPRKCPHSIDIVKMLNMDISFRKARNGMFKMSYAGCIFQIIAHNMLKGPSSYHGIPHSPSTASSLRREFSLTPMPHSLSSHV